MIRAPAAKGGRYSKPDATALGKFDRVRQQVFQNLLQALSICGDAAAEARIQIHIEGQPLVVSLVTEGPRHGLNQIGKNDLFNVESDCPGLDLRQVKNIAD